MKTFLSLCFLFGGLLTHSFSQDIEQTTGESKPRSEDKLSSDELAKLLESLDDLEKKAVNSNIKTQGNAISTFLKASQSERETFELYLECYGQVEFDEKKKKTGDKRDALRKIRDQSTNEFKRALKHQLYWLVQSMQAARIPGSRLTQGKKLVEGLELIVADVDKLSDQTVFKGPLKENPYNSVFARAFDVSHLKPNKWPTGPLDYNGLYENVIIDELIQRGDYSGVRKHWQNRIKAERTVIEQFAKKPDTVAFGKDPLQLEKYVLETVPALRWKMEQKLFEIGDERVASVELYSLLKTHQDHKSYLKWLKWLRTALTEEGE